MIIDLPLHCPKKNQLTWSRRRCGRWRRCRCLSFCGWSKQSYSSK